MEIIRGIQARPADPGPSVVTIGAFAVVHRGHRALIARVRSEAGRTDAASAVVTFDPHPMEVVAPDRAPCRLATLDQRMSGFEALDIDRLLLIGFDRSVSALEPEAFVKQVLVDALDARIVIVGEDFRFGHDRAGDVSILRELGRVHGFEVEAFSLVPADGEDKVSTSEIRRLVLDGDVAGAARLLGTNHRVAGTVVRGDGRGREIGFPTANLQVPDRTCVPGSGIYTGWWVQEGERLPGAVYVGSKPTLDGTAVGVEIHVFDLDRDLYGARGEVEFGQRIRGDQAFASLEELVEQMRRDVEEARRLLSGGGTPR